jgi:hypothetical protein
MAQCSGKHGSLCSAGRAVLRCAVVVMRVEKQKKPTTGLEPAAV